MKGKQIYFSRQEIQVLLDTLNDWENRLLTENEEEFFGNQLKRGLGTAWHKLVDANKK